MWTIVFIWAIVHFNEERCVPTALGKFQHAVRPPKMAQRPPKMAQDGPKMGQDGRKMAQDGPKMAQDGSKLVPRWSQQLSALENMPARRNAQSDWNSPYPSGCWRVRPSPDSLPYSVGGGTLPKPSPPDPAHSVGLSGGRGPGAFRLPGSRILAPFFGLRRLFLSVLF